MRSPVAPKGSQAACSAYDHCDHWCFFFFLIVTLSPINMEPERASLSKESLPGPFCQDPCQLVGGYCIFEFAFVCYKATHDGVPCFLERSFQFVSISWGMFQVSWSCLARCRDLGLSQRMPCPLQEEVDTSQRLKFGGLSRRPGGGGGGLRQGWAKCVSAPPL